MKKYKDVAFGLFCYSLTTNFFDWLNISRLDVREQITVTILFFIVCVVFEIYDLYKELKVNENNR